MSRERYLGVCNIEPCEEDAHHIVPVSEGFAGPQNWRDEVGIKRQLLVCGKHAAILDRISNP